MDQSRPFRYRPGCSAPACDRPAIYKIAATWSDGTSRELKNYGLACEAHRDSQLTAARSRHQCAQALRRRVGRPGRALRFAPGMPGCRFATIRRRQDRPSEEKSPPS